MKVNSGNRKEVKIRDYLFFTLSSMKRWVQGNPRVTLETGAIQIYLLYCERKAKDTHD